MRHPKRTPRCAVPRGLAPTIPFPCVPIRENGDAFLHLQGTLANCVPMAPLPGTSAQQSRWICACLCLHVKQGSVPIPRSWGVSPRTRLGDVVCPGILGTLHTSSARALAGPERNSKTNGTAGDFSGSCCPAPQAFRRSCGTPLLCRLRLSATACTCSRANRRRAV